MLEYNVAGRYSIQLQDLKRGITHFINENWAISFFLQMAIKLMNAAAFDLMGHSSEISINIFFGLTEEDFF